MAFLTDDSAFWLEQSVIIITLQHTGTCEGMEGILVK
jgi:hypothetical protein